MGKQNEVSILGITKNKQEFENDIVYYICGAYITCPSRAIFVIWGIDGIQLESHQTNNLSVERNI